MSEEAELIGKLFDLRCGEDRETLYALILYMAKLVEKKEGRNEIGESGKIPMQEDLHR